MELGLRDKKEQDEDPLGWCSRCPHPYLCTQPLGNLSHTWVMSSLSASPFTNASKRENQKENKSQGELLFVSPAPGELQELLLGVGSRAGPWNKGQNRELQGSTQDHMTGKAKNTSSTGCQRD